MWLENRRERLERHRGLIVLEASPDYGTGDLIGDLRGNGIPLVWTEFTARDARDEHAQADRITEALRRNLSQGPLPLGMPLDFTLRSLARMAELLGPITLAFSGLEHVPEILPTLLNLRRTGAWLVLAFGTRPGSAALPDDVLILDRDALRLTEAEALELAAGRLEPSEVHHLLQKADGAVLTFRSLLAAQLGEPPPLTYGPEGPRFALRDAPVLPNGAVLSVLLKRGRYKEALELACRRLPEEVGSFIGEAGHYFHERGLHKGLYSLLKDLPEEVRKDERVLFWLLIAAFREGDGEAQHGAVETHLRSNEAPDLRAAYAALLADPGRRLAEAKRAFEAEKTTYTSFQLAYITPNLNEALEVLEVGMRLAERGRPYELARVAGVYSWRLRESGDYQGAVHWGKYALEQFDEGGFGDYARRLRIVNDWAYARLLTGQTAGLEAVLADAEASLDEVDDALARRFRSTLADVLLALGRPGRALEFYERNVRAVPRQQVGVYSFHLVRALVEVGNNERAAEQAAFAHTLTRNLGNPLHRARADLAMGLSLLGAEPTRAKPYLTAALSFFRSGCIADYEARAALYLAKVHLDLGEEAAARRVLSASKACLDGLAPTGLALMAGPEAAFREIFELLTGKSARLEFRLLGRREIWFEGKPVELNPLHTQIVAVLAIKAKPLTLDELAEVFSEPSYTRSSLKSELSRLRKHLPVSNHPYSLQVPFTTDFGELHERLLRGDLTGALNLYRGDLLPGSEVTLLRDFGTYLLDALRQAITAARDLEGCLRLLEFNPDDLELLELAEELTQEGDPRKPLVRARAAQLRQEWEL